MNAHEYDLQSAISDVPNLEDVDPKIREEVAAYAALVDRWQEAHHALYAAEDAITRADDLDADALADAITAGKPDPGATHRAAATDALAEAQRQMAAAHRIWFAADRAIEPRLRAHAAWTREHADKAQRVAAEQYRTAAQKAEKILSDAATALEEATATVGLADSLADPRALIGYGYSATLYRTNTTEAEATAYHLLR